MPMGGAGRHVHGFVSGESHRRLSPGPLTTLALREGVRRGFRAGPALEVGGWFPAFGVGHILCVGGRQKGWRPR